MKNELQNEPNQLEIELFSCYFFSNLTQLMGEKLRSLSFTLNKMSIVD